jgi:hypothetical protein
VRIAYGKLGRVTRLDAPSNVGGDVEVINLLHRLVAEGHEVDLVTRHAGTVPAGVGNQFDAAGAFAGFPVINAETRNAICDGRRTRETLRYENALERAVRDLPRYDAWLIWLGEHNGPSYPHSKKHGSGNVRPYGSRLNLVHPLVHVLNRRGVRPIWLCPDPRNVLRTNNLRPDLVATAPDAPVLAQYDLVENRAWSTGPVRNEARIEYAYAGIELLAVDHLPGPSAAPWVDDRRPFGVMVNEGSLDDRPLARRNLVRPWVTDLGGELVGTWRAATVDALGLPSPRTVPVTAVRETVASWVATVALPASAGGWATAKPWEAFAAGTVCLAHPAYDDQDHVYGWFPGPIRRFLRPRTPSELNECVTALVTNDELRREVLAWQRYVRARARATWDRGYAAIDRALREATAKRSQPDGEAA